ncbi:MAG: GntR family transcriptional regulator [Firmicutes bacterium]|nr:GntR family transcriptional regulator [Bacillota bacterium]
MAAKAESLTLTVYNELKNAIIRSRVEPGVFLLESDLADQFKVSKSPVRGALSFLQKDGLVEVIPRKGYLVSPIKLGEVQDIYHLRQLLEPTATMQAAANCTPEFLTALKKTYKPFGVSEVDDIIERHYQFHCLVASAAHNKFLSQFIYSLLDKTLRILYYVASRGWPFPDHKEDHGAIIENIEQKDGLAAAQKMSIHLDTIRASLKDYL